MGFHHQTEIPRGWCPISWSSRWHGSWSNGVNNSDPFQVRNLKLVEMGFQAVLVHQCKGHLVIQLQHFGPILDSHSGRRSSHNTLVDGLRWFQPLKTWMIVKIAQSSQIRQKPRHRHIDLKHVWKHLTIVGLCWFVCCEKYSFQLIRSCSTSCCAYPTSFSQAWGNANYIYT